jgi:hypothetical protein
LCISKHLVCIFKSFQNLFFHLSNNYAFSSNKTENRKIEKQSRTKKRESQQLGPARGSSPGGKSPAALSLPLAD